MNDNTRELRKARTGNFFLGLVQIILNPRQGWTDAEKDRYSYRELLLTGFIPLLIIVGVAPLTSAYFKLSMTYTEAIISGVIDFSGYFVSVYLCAYLLEWGLEKWVGPKKASQNSLMTFIIYTISVMAFITLLTDVLPVDLSLWSFLPLYVIYIIWCGGRFLGIPSDRKPQFLAVGLLGLFCPPYIILYCLSFLV